MDIDVCKLEPILQEVQSEGRGPTQVSQEMSHATTTHNPTAELSLNPGLQRQVPSDRREELGLQEVQVTPVQVRH